MKGDGFHQREIINPCDALPKAKQCLEEFKKVCEDSKIKFCLWYGTALGAYRDKTFIQGDHDIDILIILKKQSYEEILDTLTEELCKFGWEELWIHPEGQCHYFKDGILIDVWFMRKDKQAYIPLTRYGSKNIHAKEIDSWDRKHFGRLDEIEFMDSVYPIPAYIEECLSRRYDAWEERLLIGE